MELTTSKKIYYEENKDRIRAREKNRILNMTQEELKNYRERRNVAGKKYNKTHRELINARKRGFYKNNVELQRARSRDYYKRTSTPMQTRMHHLKYFFKISLDKYDEMWVEQMGLCPICQMPLDYGYSAHVDHDHLNGQIRGLLHSKCNSALGFVNESPKVINNLLNYVGAFNG